MPPRTSGRATSPFSARRPLPLSSASRCLSAAWLPASMLVCRYSTGAALSGGEDPPAELAVVDRHLDFRAGLGERQHPVPGRGIGCGPGPLPRRFPEHLVGLPDLAP